MYSSRGGLQPEYRATGSVSRKRKQRRVLLIQRILSGGTSRWVVVNRVPVGVLGKEESGTGRRGARSGQGASGLRTTGCSAGVVGRGSFAPDPTPLRRWPPRQVAPLQLHLAGGVPQTTSRGSSRSKMLLQMEATSPTSTGNTDAGARRVPRVPSESYDCFLLVQAKENMYHPRRRSACHASSENSFFERVVGCGRYPGCNRVFALPGALHTHTGWHKRKENISAGVYDRLGHHLKVSVMAGTTSVARSAHTPCSAAINRRSTVWQMPRGGLRYLRCTGVTSQAVENCFRVAEHCIRIR